MATPNRYTSWPAAVVRQPGGSGVLGGLAELGLDAGSAGLVRRSTVVQTPSPPN
jgi:hypothetical protein